jgi:hypothetical protein
MHSMTWRAPSNRVIDSTRHIIGWRFKSRNEGLSAINAVASTMLCIGSHQRLVGLDTRLGRGHHQSSADGHAAVAVHQGLTMYSIPFQPYLRISEWPGHGGGCGKCVRGPLFHYQLNLRISEWCWPRLHVAVARERAARP